MSGKPTAPTQPITDLNQLDPNRLYSYADYLTWPFTERVELFKGYVFPSDLCIICDEGKLDERGCLGAIALSSFVSLSKI